MITRSKRTQHTTHSFLEELYETEDEISNDESDSDFVPYDDEELDEIYRIMEESQPNIQKILKLPISLRSKARLVEMFEVYNNLEEHTEEWLSMKERINETINFYKDIDPEVLNTKNELEEHSSLFGDNLELSILTLPVEKKVKQVIYNAFKKYLQQNDKDEKSKLRSWLHYAISLPFSKTTSHKEMGIDFMKKAREKLDAKIYGMERVKEDILTHLNNRIHGINNGASNNIALVGPPGVGKTLISSVVSEILSLPFAKIYLPSSKGVEYLKGQDFTWIGSHPGILVKKLIEMQTNNGILFFDEIDKVSSPEVVSVLLQMLDPLHNRTFDDVYLEGVPIDLSNILFLFSMNQLPESKPLRDRLTIIRVPGYTKKEKVDLLINFIVPEMEKQYTTQMLKVSKKLAEHIIDFVAIRGEHKEKKVNSGIRAVKNCVQELLKRIFFISTNKNRIDYNFYLDLPDFPINLTIKQFDHLIKK